MTQGSRDWIWALVVAALLLGIAALIVLVMHPDGGQVGWYTGLLPGSIAGAILAGAVQSDLPRAQSLVYLLSLIAVSFLWYVVIGFIVVKIVRAFALARKA